MKYGNSSMGYSYSPDRRNDKVNHDDLRSTFLGANGNRQNGYYSSSSSSYASKSNNKGRYLGNGQYVED